MITVDFKKLPVRPLSMILDIGCGTGRHSCAAARLRDVTVLGLDINFDEAVETRNRLLFERKCGVQGGGRWKTMVADITGLPFSRNTFDLVICSEVLEHIPDQDAAIYEMIRVLKPGKDLIVSVPRYFPERICWALSDEYHNVNNGHLRIYRKKELTARLENAGLEKWSHHFAHGFHTPYWWLKCIVGPTREESFPVKIYHRFLVWEIMKGPIFTRFLEKLVNPLMGKSLVLYLKKGKYA